MVHALHIDTEENGVIITISAALSPYLEAMSCNLERFFTILHCIGGMCTVLFYMLLADRYVTKLIQSHVHM